MRAGVDVDFGRLSARVSGRYVQGRKDNDFNAPGFPIVDYDDFTVVDATADVPPRAAARGRARRSTTCSTRSTTRSSAIPLQGASFKRRTAWGSEAMAQALGSGHCVDARPSSHGKDT